MTNKQINNINLMWKGKNYGEGKGLKIGSKWLKFFINTVIWMVLLALGDHVFVNWVSIFI